jgi:hypothetical protein
LAIFCFVIIALYPILILSPGYLPEGNYPSTEQTTGMISVVSEPVGADTFLDGISTGSHTPCLLTKISPGTHTVMVSKSGYQSESDIIEVFKGKTTDIKFILTLMNRTFPATGTVNPESDGSSSFWSSGSGVDSGSSDNPTGGSESTQDGRIRVTSSHPMATIHINGAVTDQVTPATLVKSPGVYEISVSLDGFQTPQAKTLTVISGQQVEVDFKLAPIINTPEFPSLSFTAIAIILFGFTVCGIRLMKE